MNNIFKNITPAVAVMLAGLLGAYLVYDNYFTDKTSSVVVQGIEPASGEEAAAPATTEGATPAATGMEDHVDAVTTTDTGEVQYDSAGNVIAPVATETAPVDGTAVTTPAEGAPAETAPAPAEDMAAPADAGHTEGHTEGGAH